MSDTATIELPETRTRTRPKPRHKPVVKQPGLWHVVLHDDSHHSYEYVMRMVSELFYKDFTAGFKIAQTVDTQGRVVVETCHKERAEFKRDQIHAYGADWRIEACSGSMTATIEPAWSDEDDDESGSD